MSKRNDIVSEVIGDWGRWQLRTTILIYLCKIPSAWFMACIIFTAPTPNPGEYYCQQPGNSLIENKIDWMNIAQVMVQTDVHYANYCTTSFNFSNIKTTANLSNFMQDERVVVPCTSFEFNSSFESTVTKFNLVCSRSILIAVSQFFHLFGVLTGGILATKLLEV